MRILIVEDNDPFRQFVVTTLENQLRNVDIVEATSLKVAQLLYSSDPYFESIIISLDMDSGSALTLIHHIQQINSKIPIITMTDQAGQQNDKNEEETIAGTKLLHKGTKEGKPAKLFKEALLNLEPFQKYFSQQLGERSYAQIKIFYLWRFEELPFDLYVKINDKKYVKVLTKNTKYDEPFIEKYHTKDNEYLYLESRDYPLLENLLYSDHWFDELNELSPEDQSYRMKKIIQNMASSMGLTPHLIQKAEEVVQAAITHINQSKNLSKIFNQKQKGASFQANASTLITYITSALCDELEWSTNSSKEKLAFAAIFQDTSLKSSKQSSLFYANLEELDQLGLTKEEKGDFYNHPLRSAQMVKEINTKFPQVEDIIAHHHERPDGSGFPTGINFQKLPPLSSLFIVAHDYVMRSIINRFEKDQEEILKEMAPHYESGHFKKCFAALKKIIS